MAVRALISLLLISAASSHLISVLSILVPPIITPPVLYSWSASEPVSSLTREGEESLRVQIAEITENYSELFQFDQGTSIIYGKNQPWSIQAAQLIAKSLPFEATVVTPEESEDFLLSASTACGRIAWLMERDRLDTKQYTEIWGKIYPFLSSYSEIIGENATIHSLLPLGETLESYSLRKINVSSAVNETLQSLAISLVHTYTSFLLYGSKDQAFLATYMIFNEINKTLTSNKVPELQIFLPDSGLFNIISRTFGSLNFIRSLHIEVHYEKGEKLIKLKQGEDYVEIIGCESVCSSEKFQEVFGRVFYKSQERYLRRCKVVGDYPETVKKYLIYAGLIGLVLFIFKWNLSLALATVNKYKDKIM